MQQPLFDNFKQIWFVFELISCEVQDYELVRTLSCPRENCPYFTRLFQALVMPESPCLTLGSIALFKAIFLMAACLESCVVNMDSHSSDLTAFWKRTERI